MILFFLNFLIFVSALFALTQSSPIMYSVGILVVTLFTGAWMWGLGLKWIALALWLVYCGGMMVIFIYITSLAPNSKVALPSPKKLTLALMISLIALKISNSHLWINPVQWTLFFSFSGTQIILTTLYLLVTLFLVTKLVETFKGALRLKYFSS